MRNQLKMALITLEVIFSAQFNSTFGQVTTGTNAISAGQYVGSSTSVDVDNVAQQNQNINFYTNGGTTYPWANQRMTILNTGNVGIGTSGPSELLQVLGGNIDVNTSTNSYMIHQDPVLWHNGNVTNIFVGVDAGSGGGGSSNTLVGNAAGYTNSATGGNTFIGSYSGYNQTGGGENTFIGSNAGLTNVDGNLNCYLGGASGYYNEHGTSNTLMGYNSGWKNLADKNSCFGVQSGYNIVGVASAVGTPTGTQNSYFGFLSGPDNVDGSFNASIGDYSGIGSLLDSNTFLGSHTGVVTGLEFSATAVGANAIVPQHHQMILGDNNINVGIGLSGDNNVGLPQRGPGNKLEINADQNSFEYSGLGLSGLRFRQLTDAITPGTNTARGVLSVDGVGDVVLVYERFAGANNGTSLDAATGTTVQLGQDAIGGLGADLLNDRDVPMSNFDLYFTDATSNLDVLHNNIAMGILFPNPSTSPARLTVEKATTVEGGLNDPIAGEFTAWCGEYNALGRGIGVWGKALEIAGNTNYELMGGRFEGKGTTGSGTYGVWAQAAGDRNIWGGKFDAAGNPATTVGIGVEGRAAKAAFNIGVYGFTQAPVPPSLNYAVYGDLGIVGPLPPPCVFLPCPPVTFPDAAGYFNGDMVSTTSFFSLSDGSFKTNVEDIQNALGIINQLNPKSYTFSQELHPSMQMPTGSHYGLISQEVQNILPGVVKDCIHPARYDSVGNEIYAAINFKALNYTELIPFLIAGMKEQQQTIEAMQAQIANLTGSGNRHANPGGNGDDGNSNSIDIELKNIREIVLNQNFPNPFAEYTTITFVISDDVKKAQILFYDDKGTILKSVDINEKGEGQINVYAPDLSSGIYKYTLITDGKPVETKQMVKSN